jgi:uncharacterized membrane protein YesL
MQRSSGLMAGIYGLTEWITRFSLLNLQWMGLNLPVLVIGFFVLVNPTDFSLVLYVLLLMVWMPFVGFPSTIAALAKVREWIMPEDQVIRKLSYLSHFKEDYRRKVLFSAGLTLLWVIWGTDFYYLNEQSVLLGIILLLVGGILFGYTINSLSMYVHYDLPNRELYKNSFILTMGRPVLLLTIIAGNAFVWYISTVKFLFLIPFFTVSLSAFLSFWAFYQCTSKIRRKVQSGENF